MSSERLGDEDGREGLYISVSIVAKDTQQGTSGQEEIDE